MEKTIIQGPTSEIGADHYFKSKNGGSFHFKIADYTTPGGIKLDAVEITQDASPGYNFSQMCPFEGDIRKSKKKLIEKIKKWDR